MFSLTKDDIVAWCKNLADKVIERSHHQTLSNLFSPGLLLCLALILSIVLIIILLVTDNPKDYVVLISALAVVMGVFITSAVKLYSEMRDRAFDLLKASHSDRDYITTSINVRAFLRRNPELTRDQIIEFYTTQDSDIVKIRREIGKLGNFYEDMAIAIRHKEVNEILLREYHIGLLVRFYEGIANLLPFLRNEVDEKPFGNDDRSEIFEAFEWLYRRWEPLYKKKQAGSFNR